MGQPANYEVVSRSGDEIVIRDLGPWDKHLTVTNDAQGVIERLGVKPGERLFYYDSYGEYGEIIVEDGKFARFAIAYPRTPVSRGRDEPWRR